MYLSKLSKSKFYTRIVLTSTSALALVFTQILFWQYDYRNSTILANDESIISEALSSPVSFKEADIAEDLYYIKNGKASYYGKRFNGRKTASGEIFNMQRFTAAHKSLPFGSIVRVTNIENGKSAFVRINDRGPFSKSRILDLSRHAASTIEGLGLPEVKMEGFVQGNELPKKLINENYYYAFSYNRNLLCLPEPFFNISASTNDFDEAVSLYNDFIIKDPNSYLLVFTEINCKNEDESAQKYCIASLRERIFLPGSVDYSMK